MKKNQMPSLPRLCLDCGLAMTVVFFIFAIFSGCTVKAVGDPNRPITINANVVVDIRGLKQTAASIEDQIAQGG